MNEEKNRQLAKIRKRNFGVIEDYWFPIVFGNVLLISIRCFQRFEINTAGEIHKIAYYYRKLHYNKPNLFFKIAA